MTQRLEELFQCCTVKITIPSQIGWGTGFFVAPGLILTCAHVVKALDVGATAQIRWQQQSDFATAELVQIESQLDLALLQFTPTKADLPCVYLDESLQSGQELYFFGYPDQDFDNGCPVTGNCEGFTGDVPPLIKFKQAQVRPGMSGSALLNQHTGKVCGIVKFTRDRASDLGGGAIPTRVILEQFPELRSLQQAFHGGDRRWVNLITQPGIDFQSYRKAVICHYSQQRHLYTPTDALLPLEARSVERQAQDDGQKQQPEKTVEQFPVLDGLRKYALGNQREHVLLAGRPGSGKSTTLRQLATSLAKEGQVPVLVQLKGDRPVLEAIASELEKGDLYDLEPKEIKRLLRQQRFVLLLDGVNEIPNDDLRRSLTQFRKDNPTVSMIFTTRDLSLGGDLGIGKRLEMQPLSEQQMREFVRKYLPEQGDRLLGQLSDRLRELAETPLLLKMLCDMFQQMGTIPQSKGELFRRFDEEYERFKGLPAASAEFRRFKPEILQRLAWVMMQGDTENPTEPWLTFPRTQAETAIEQWLTNRVSDPASKAKEWLEDLLEHHLLQIAADPRQIEFHHQLFQEYYAAEYLLRLLPTLADEQLKRDYLNYLKWTEPVDLMLSLLEEDSKSAKRLRDLAQDVDFNLSVNLYRNSNSRSKKLEEDDIQSLLERLNSGGLTSGVAPEKLKAFARNPSKSSAVATENLSFNADDSASKSESSNFDVVVKGLIRLIQTVEDSKSLGRQRAIQILVELGSEECIPTLLKVLDEDPDYFVREKSVWALVKLGSETCVPSLLKILNDTNNHGDFRLEASKALAELGSKAAIQGLTDAINHSDPGIRSNATFAMRFLDLEIAIPVLLKAIKDVDSQVRCVAVLSFGFFDSEVAIQSILKATKDSDKQIRVEAVREISKYNAEAVIQSILEALKDPAPEVRCAAVKALIETNSEIIVPELLKAIKDAEQKVRFEAAMALADLGFEIAIPELLQTIKDNLYTFKYGGFFGDCPYKLFPQRFSHVRGAIQVLGKMDSEAAILELIGLFNLPESDSHLVYPNIGDINYGLETLEVTVAHVLQDVNFDSDTLAFTLINAVDHPEPEIREKISKLLKNVTFKGAVPKLEQLIHHSDSNIQIEAIAALGNIGSEQTIGKLLEIIQSLLAEALRASAAQALGKLGFKSAVPALLNALGDLDAYGRAITAQALGKLGFKSAVPALLNALGDLDAYVRANAIEGLGKIGSEDAVLVLARIIDQPDREYREPGRRYGGIGCRETDDLGEKVIEALGRIASKDAIEVLLKAIDHEDRNIREAAADAFGEINFEIMIQCLSRLQEKYRSPSLKSGSWQVLKAITAIQNRCKFYNYKIFQAHLAAQKTDRQNHPNSDPNAISIQTLERLTIMTDKAPIFHQQHATIGVNYAAEGSIVEFTQNTSSSEQTFEILLTDYKQFIEQLQQKYPTLADAATVPQIIEVEAKLIEAQDQQRWQNFLNLKRLWNGSKKAGIKVGEHFAENNVWAKGAIAFLEGVSEDVK